MAKMYYRPGAVYWETLSAGAWSWTSGGPSNNLIPDRFTDVVFDANSSKNCAVIWNNEDGDIACKSITTAGWNGNLRSEDGSSIAAWSGLVDLSGLSAGLQCSWVFASSGVFTFKPPNTVDATTACTISVLGNVTLIGHLSLGPLQALYIDSEYAVFNGSGFDVACRTVSCSRGKLNMGSGTWTLNYNGNNSFYIAPIAVLNAESSTLKLITYNGPAGYTELSAPGMTLNKLWLVNSGSGFVRINPSLGGSLTINELRIEGGMTLQFATGQTYSIGSLILNGSKAARVKLTRMPTGSFSNGNYTFQKLGGGMQYVDYADISFSNASPGATWFARNSVDSGGNIGWIFSRGNSNFFSFM